MLFAKRWPTPDRDSGGQHENDLRLSFRESEIAGPCAPNYPPLQSLAHRAVNVSEPIHKDSASRRASHRYSLRSNILGIAPNAGPL